MSSYQLSQQYNFQTFLWSIGGTVAGAIIAAYSWATYPRAKVVTK